MAGGAPLLLGAIALTAISGLPTLILGRQSRVGQRWATALMVLGAIAGLLGVWQVFSQGKLLICQVPSPIPNAEFVLAADYLSAFFLAPIFLVAVLGSIYGLSYWKATDHPGNARRLQCFYGLLTASLVVLVVSQTSVAFLMGWEGMALSAFLAIGTEHEQREVGDAAWLYLAASHVATLALFVMFGLLYAVTGSYELVPVNSGAIPPSITSVIFLLGLVGFGLKAGLMPLHFWLPSAHAMAPSHVSALMSGVLIKVGIYGLVRITWILPDPPLWWGGLLLALGAISAVFGVAFALGQHDLKRLLAYHSIENIGIIVIGLALALIGRTLGQEAWIVLGLAGCLLHVWNHAIFKSLLFYSAGSVIHAEHTREIDHMGGLARNMPWTAAAFLLGATAICGLPPLNGFVSEFLIYFGLFHTLGNGQETSYPLAAFVIPALALMGALAVACFVKAFGVVFLGVSRSTHTSARHESPWPMLVPLCVLSIVCVAIGTLPTLVAPLLNRAVGVWVGRSLAGAGAIEHLAPLRSISMLATVLLAALVLGAALLRRHLRTHLFGRAETWGCGYMAPTPRMQYTASSMAQFLVELLAWSLRPEFDRPQIDTAFPRDTEFSSHIPEVVLDHAVTPTLGLFTRAFQWCRLMQQGSVQIYLFYILAILMLLLLISR